MLSLILPFVNCMEKRAIPPYQLFLRQQSKIILDRYTRLYNAAGKENQATAMLRFIMNFTDMEYMLRQPNNYNRYLYHIRDIRRSIEGSFDRVMRGRGYQGVFFRRSRTFTEEFIMPTDDVGSITNLPLETDDWNVWKKIHPVRLLGHDSPEYTINLLGDTINYSEIPPNYAFIMIDVAALILKYYSWYTQERMNEPNQELVHYIPQQLFLHKYVICNLAWDNFNVWLLNNLYRLSDYVHENGTSHITEEFHAKALEYEQQWGRLSEHATEAFRYLGVLLGDTKKTLRPEAIMSSKILLSGSVLDYANQMVTRWSLPISDQYDYLRWMRDKPLFNFILSVYLHRRDLPITQRMVMNVRRDYKRLMLHRPWRYCINVLLKNEIQSDMEQTEARLFSI